VSFTGVLVAAHRSHAQALADGEVSVSAYPHLDLGLTDFDALAAVHSAILPAISKSEARSVFDDVEAEGSEPGRATYILPDQFTQAAASLDDNGVKQVAARLHADESFKSASMLSQQIETFVTALAKLGEEATQSGKDILVVVK
jgi:hypothetical protein